MQESYEFRVVEEFAHLLFGDGEGKKLSSGIRLVQLASLDPRIEEIGQLQQRLRRQLDRPFFFGWEIKRRYSRQELEAASLLHLRILSVFEPAGEECGTKYDESAACICGAGAKQISDLYLDLDSIPKGKEISKTIAGELIVSQRFVERFKNSNLTGVTFSPVRSGNIAAASSEWFQMNVRSCDVEITAPTKTGVDPFDSEPAVNFQCPGGDLLGLSLLSSVYVTGTRAAWPDVAMSRQFIGVRRGLLRPERVLFISPHAWQVLDLAQLKGCKVEVAHVV